MKIEIDWRPDSFYGIRLYPENNKEMADLERFVAVKLEPEKIERILGGDSLNYLIKFNK